MILSRGLIQNQKTLDYLKFCILIRGYMITEILLRDFFHSVIVWLRCGYRYLETVVEAACRLKREQEWCFGGITVLYKMCGKLWSGSFYYSVFCLAAEWKWKNSDKMRRFFPVLCLHQTFISSLTVLGKCDCTTSYRFL